MFYNKGLVEDYQLENPSALVKEGEWTLDKMYEMAVTVASTKVEGLKAVIDLTEEWDKLESGSRLITGTLVVNAEFAEKYPQWSLFSGEILVFMV